MQILRQKVFNQQNEESGPKVDNKPSQTLQAEMMRSQRSALNNKAVNVRANLNASTMRARAQAALQRTALQKKSTELSNQVKVRMTTRALDKQQAMSVLPKVKVPTGVAPVIPMKG